MSVVSIVQLVCSDIFISAICLVTRLALHKFHYPNNTRRPVSRYVIPKIADLGYFILLRPKYLPELSK
jgi:hypothetical protein